MSEYIRNQNQRLEKLYELSKMLIETGSARSFYTEFEPFINTVTAEETMHVLDRLIVEEVPFELIKANLGKLLNLFHKSLKSSIHQLPNDDHFLHYLMLENRGVEKIMEHLKGEFKKVREGSKFEEYYRIKQLLVSLKDYELHYLKKENILFPYIEKTIPHFRCLQLMWSFHDDFRRLLKQLIQMLESEKVNIRELNKAMGDLFFVVLPVIFREEYILYPLAYVAIPETAWLDMMYQSNEIGWSYIEVPKQMPSNNSIADKLTPGLVNLDTGMLSAQQIILMMENLPIDITFVDENDEVRYFSGIKHRIFPRSKAIIGRKVQNCHPKESVHLVNEIVKAFKNGTRSHADFWIKMKGRFIHIRYFALHDEAGNYKGTIEVSQDVTEIRALEGEQRLLNWEREA